MWQFNLCVWQKHIQFPMKHLLIMLMDCVQDNSYVYIPKASVEYFSLQDPSLQ